MMRVWLSNDRNMAQSCDLRKKLGSIPESWNSATHTVGHFMLGDFDDERRMLRGASLQRADTGLQEEHQHPEEKRVCVMMVPAKLHYENSVIDCVFRFN